MKKVFIEKLKQYNRVNIVHLCKAYNINNIIDYFKKIEENTVDLTKAISPIITELIREYALETKGLHIIEEKDAYDINYKGKLIEAKMTRANNDIVKAWTGNKSSTKVPLHLLMAYNIGKLGIEKLFAGMIDTSKLKSAWEGHSSSHSSFSSLKIPKEDVDKMHILIGKRRPIKKNAKYAYFECENIYE
ncbi:MAG: hypothetical protein ACOC1K_03400 [Nanoarchaeota archaeon]